jgi:hypothetical protein
MASLIERAYSYLRNVACMPNKVRGVGAEVFKILPVMSKHSRDIQQYFKQKSINEVFADLDDIDDKRPSFLVCNSHFRMLRYVEPLLSLAREAGYQIIVLNAPRAAFDSEQFKMTQYIKKYKIINLPPWHRIFETSQTTMPEYIYFFYALLYNYNIKTILVEELHHPPLSRFVDDFPYIKALMPPIIAFKHALLFPDYLGEDGLRSQAEILNNYCDLHFVWGDLQKKMYSHLPEEKIISAGWNALDRLKSIETSSGKKMFLAAGASYSAQTVAEKQIVEELLDQTDLEIYVKAHPDPVKKAGYPSHERVHILGDFDDYIPILASCAFSLSYGSNIFVESLCLKKPHVILPTKFSQDRIFDPVRRLVVYDPSAGRVEADKLIKLVESQNLHWDLMDEYLSEVAANRFNSSEFMFRQIQAEIDKYDQRLISNSGKHG